MKLGGTVPHIPWVPQPVLAFRAPIILAPIILAQGSFQIARITMENPYWTMIGTDTVEPRIARNTVNKRFAI